MIDNIHWVAIVADIADNTQQDQNNEPKLPSLRLRWLPAEGMTDCSD
jgi:hypothetical protein